MFFSFDVGRWAFDLPEADKCLLASGEFDVHLLRRLDLFWIVLYFAAGDIQNERQEGRRTLCVFAPLAL